LDDLRLDHILVPALRKFLSGQLCLQTGGDRRPQKLAHASRIAWFSDGTRGLFNGDNIAAPIRRFCHIGF
jgi:hypothetical protein